MPDRRNPILTHRVINSCCLSRGINEENISNAFNKVRSEWGCVVQSAEVKAMVQVNTSYVH